MAARTHAGPNRATVSRHAMAPSRSSACWRDHVSNISA